MRSALRWWAVVVVGILGCRPNEAGHVRFGAAPDFGEVPLGARRSTLLVIENDGPKTVAISLSTEGEFTVEPAELSMPARTKTSVAIEFDAVALGERTAALTAVVDGVPTVLTLRALVTGPAVSVARSLRIQPAYWVVGGRPEISRTELALRNVGTEDSQLTLGPPRVEGSGDLCVGHFVNGTCEAWMPPGLVSTTDVVALPLELQPHTDAAQTWTVILPTSDALQSEVRIEVSAQAELVSPCEFDAPLRLYVGNAPLVSEFPQRGPNPCLLRSVELSTGSPFALEVTPPPPVKLARGASFTTRITVEPAAPSDARGTLVIDAIGSDPTEISVERSVGECVEISPSSLDLGTMRQNCSGPSVAVAVRNLCSFPLSVGRPVMGSAAGEAPGGPNCPGTFACPEFRITSSWATDIQLPPDGGAATFSVHYRPINYGADTGAVIISVGSLDFVVALQGRGDFSGLNTDTFRVDAPPRVDLLTVVDTSPSFVPRRQAVRAELASLLQTLGTPCRDVRFGIAAAEGAGDAGVHLMTNDAGQAWTLSQQPDFVGRALSAFDALPVGSEVEACIRPATELFVDAGVRSGSTAAGLCITDALEQSLDPQAALQSFRALSPSASWNVVAGTAGGPTCGEESTDDGTHRALVDPSNGAFESICTQWGRNLVPTSVCVIRDQFWLSSRPDGPIEVRLDGVLADPAHWTYDTVGNAVQFTAGHAPAPGVTITVTYGASCVP